MGKLRTPELSSYIESTEAAKLFPVTQELPGAEITSEQMDQHFRELVDSRDNYPEHWQKLTGQLQELFNTNPDIIRFGPEYRIGEEHPTTVTTIFFDYVAPPPRKVRRDFCLIAKDESGAIVGDWYQTTGLNQRTNTIETNGLLCINEKGRGSAMSINLAIWHLLQMEANQKNADLEWPFHNSNQESLDALLDQYRRTKEESLEPKIRDMKKQQERWQSMYGPNGKLGVGKDGMKHLHPKDEGPGKDLESISEIALERINTDDGQSYPRVVSIQTLNEPNAQSALRTAHLAKLEALLNLQAKETVQ